MVLLKLVLASQLATTGVVSAAFFEQATTPIVKVSTHK